MKCHHCDSQATVHLTQIINGQMHKMDLCEACAQEKGVTNPDNLSIGNLLDENPSKVDASTASMTCESCGTTHQDFKKGGRLGCEACYHVFRPVLEPLLDGMHAGVKHFGKVPSRSVKKKSDDDSEELLNKELKKAVEEENYEKAAKLRDRLKKLQAKSSASA
ncbi:UvrB/UvrC motif-containing protein [Opitutales bacterium]|jgi:protein arginine kinase activator|nr:UvrB/UvrC motif-containing protein [Opitutales bacterium]MDA9119347.1 UvrB/UvrC motif-containing protein [Opitutales bacterium]MDB3957740.1 UvrB/UvrC motif-containing protein [Opitutales bacterium]